MPTGIIFTTNSFYKIEINNFSCKSKLFSFSFINWGNYVNIYFLGFFTDSIAKTHDYRPLFVCELTKNKEYLLCYNVYGVFVDTDGKRTRNGEMKWPYSPNNFGVLSIYYDINHSCSNNS